MRVDPFEENYCHEMSSAFVSTTGATDSFLFVDLENEVIILDLQIDQEPGLYDGYSLQFYFIDYPEVNIDVPISITLSPCELTSVKFKDSKIFETYVFNDDEFSLSLPDLVTEPNCGGVYELEEVQFQVTDVPNEVDPLELVLFDYELQKVTWLKIVNLKIYSQILAVKVNAKVEDFDLEVTYEVNYDSDGPEFDDPIAGTPEPVLTFSEDDIDWSYTLPPLVAEDQ